MLNPMNNDNNMSMDMDTYRQQSVEGKGKGKGHILVICYMLLYVCIQTETMQDEMMRYRVSTLAQLNRLAQEQEVGVGIDIPNFNRDTCINLLKAT